MERYDIDAIYRLLAATVRLARRDARRDPKAAAWLDEHCPTWRRYERQRVAENGRIIDKSAGGDCGPSIQ